jgi:hypothetical protein
MPFWPLPLGETIGYAVKVADVVGKGEEIMTWRRRAVVLATKAAKLLGLAFDAAQTD